MAIDIVFPCSN